MTKVRSRILDPNMAHDFLTGFHIAVVGASPDGKNFGRTVLRALRAHGYDAIPVNPEIDEVDGERCYPNVSGVPGTLDGAIVMVNSDRAIDVVRECAAHGVRKVWLFKGLGGPGAVSDEVIALCEELGIEAVAGACPLMFLPPVRGAHRLHRAFRRLNGSLAPDRDR